MSAQAVAADQVLTVAASVLVVVFLLLDLLLWAQWRVLHRGPRWEFPVGRFGMTCILVTFALTTWPVTW